MSVSRNVYLYCDHEGCEWNNGPVFDPPDVTAAAARSSAREIGWVQRGAKDYCAEHAKRGQREGLDHE